MALHSSVHPPDGQGLIVVCRPLCTDFLGFILAWKRLFRGSHVVSVLSCSSLSLSLSLCRQNCRPRPPKAVWWFARYNEMRDL